MKQWLYKLDPILNVGIVRIMLFVVVGIYVFNVFPYGTLGVFMRNVLVRGLVAFVVISLALKKEWLTAHLVIFLLGFSAAGANFINTLLSYSFSAGTFFGTFTLSWLLNTLAFVYLVLYFLVQIVRKPRLDYHYETHSWWFYVALLFIFYLFRNSFNTAVFTVLPVALIALRKHWFHSKILAMALLVSLPINFVIDLSAGGIGWRPVSYFVYVLAGTVLLGFIGKALWTMHQASAKVPQEDSESDVKPSEPEETNKEAQVSEASEEATLKEEEGSEERKKVPPPEASD